MGVEDRRFEDEEPQVRGVLEGAPPAPVVVVGGSTGGPAAFRTFLDHLLLPEGACLVLAQHMPAELVEGFARNLERTSGRPVRVAEHGRPLRPRVVWVAPAWGDLSLVHGGSRLVAAMEARAGYARHRPSVDVLFSTAARACGRDTVAVVLSGMGRDGLCGARAVVRAGGVVLAQDEASSVAWGMPGAVVRAGLARAAGTASQLARWAAAALARRAA